MASVDIVADMVIATSLLRYRFFVFYYQDMDQTAYCNNFNY